MNDKRVIAALFVDAVKLVKTRNASLGNVLWFLDIRDLWEAIEPQ